MLKSIIASFIGTILAIAAIAIGGHYLTNQQVPSMTSVRSADTYSDYMTSEYVTPALAECHTAEKAAELLKGRTFRISGVSTFVGEEVVAHAYLDEPGPNHEALCIKMEGFHIPTKVQVVNGELQFAK